MKALILVGGYGTRLRPLTFSCPKPLVPFCNLPIVLHQVKALVAVGVKRIILAVNYQPQAMMDMIPHIEKEYGVKIEISQEDTPLGTAGPLALAREKLLSDDSPFFMLNSDVICDFPLADMLNFHTAHKREGTILVTQVTDPSKYGVVVSDDSGKILSFVEKPQTFVSNKINAGIYLFNTSVLKRIQLKPTSIEREIFPVMAAESQIYSMALGGYWMDVGQPHDFITGTQLHLQYLSQHDPSQLFHQKDAEEGKNITIVGNVVISKTAKIGINAVIGPDVVIGDNVSVEDGARIKQTTVMNNATIQKHAFVSKSIVGWESKLGAWSRVTSSILGEDVVIAPEVYINQATVCPHKEVKADSPNAAIIL